MKILIGLVSAVALSAAPALAQSDDPAADQDAVDDQDAVAEDAVSEDGGEAEEVAAEDDPFRDAIRSAYVEEHVWVGDSVEIDEEKVGEISRVYYDADGLIGAIVVDDGDREVEVDILQSHARSDTEEVVVFWLDLDKAQFDALPELDVAQADAAAPADDDAEEEEDAAE